MELPSIPRIPKIEQIADMAFDMGTANVECFIKGQGLMQIRDTGSEEDDGDATIMKSFLARDTRKGKVVAIGNDAYDQIGRTASTVHIERPVKHGRIYEQEAFYDIMEHLIKRRYPAYHLSRQLQAKPMIIVPIPCNATEVEQKAVREVIEELHAEPKLVWEPVAAVIGARLDYKKPKSCTIIDIGGGTTDFAVLARGRVLPYCKSIEIGGDLMSQAIINYALDTYKLSISLRSAEWVKKKIGSAIPFEGGKILKAGIKGRPLTPGSKRELELNSDEIRKCLMKTLTDMADAVKDHIDFIEEAQVHSDLQENGISLTGGGSLIDGMDQFLTEALGFKVNRVEKPLLSVILGAGEMLNNPELLKEFEIAA